MKKTDSKEKKPSIARHFSAGGTVYKKDKGKVYWLIIKPTGTDRWQLPKGTVNPGESSIAAAQREVGEEGGVEVKVGPKIGVQKYYFVLNGEKVFKTVTFFLMEYLAETEEGHDWEADEVKFVSYEKAISLLTFENDRETLSLAQSSLSLPV